ncbi:MAG TPA: hypothetical protein PL155_07685 [Candidatus Omnitrophota bacterium]|nr:hypothetical protein [Candidatus Omnitrophota bacterium]HPD85285.1 hypothetical protein [Candidatus Omnitrophota bacterium]HRZ04214.1 hypothetical protein [Candidatus Omnitrophota bacterium]
MRILSILLIIIGLCINPSGNISAENQENTAAYKLAAFHTRTLDPHEALTRSVTPASALIYEFEGIFSSLKNRCLNSEDDIADTIVRAWQLMQARGYDLSVLQIAHALATNARDVSLFGPGKVNFRKTSGWWTSQRKPRNK